MVHKASTAPAAAKAGKRKGEDIRQSTDILKPGQYDLAIGIDPGVNTGYALYDVKRKKLKEVQTLSIVEAMQIIINLHVLYKIIVRYEDARQRTWFGKAGREQLQGAGSIKRDCAIWQEFFEYHQIPHQAVAPKHNRTKLEAAQFKALTGWAGRTSEHARDAAMLIFGRI